MPLCRGNNADTILGGSAFSKFGRAKNVQNSVRSRTTFNFDREYLWNAWSYRQPENGIVSSNLSRVEKKLVNFAWLTKKLWARMLKRPKSTMRVLRMLMHLSSGHVNLLPGEFELPKFFPSRTYGAGRTYVGLCPKFLVLVLLHAWSVIYATSTQHYSINSRKQLALVVAVIKL